MPIIDGINFKRAYESFHLYFCLKLQLDVQYLHPHAAFDASIGLNPNPLLELSATIGSKELSLGGEVAFDTAYASFIKYNAGISLNKHDYSAALLL